MTFHVPEQYRVTNNPMILSSIVDGNNGAFDLPSPISGWRLAIIASDGSSWKESGLKGEPWEHVSIHAYKSRGKRQRAPIWAEMCFVKNLFWDDTETVIQYHPAKTDYLNLHNSCLHLWRPIKQLIPMPPLECV